MMNNDMHMVRRVIWIWIWVVLVKWPKQLRSLRHTLPLPFPVAFPLEPRRVSDNLTRGLFGEVLLEQGFVARNKSIE
jgi:hypothetical protein